MANMGRVATWKNIGRDVTGCSTARDVLAKAGLDYTVEKKPVYDLFEGRYRKSSEWFWTRRKSDGHKYGIVKRGYELVQNLNAFEFVDYIPDFEYVKAGETGKGEIYIIGKVPDVDILGDAFTPYIVFINSFAGQSSIKIILSPLRCVCENQVPIISKEAENADMFRHTKSVKKKIKQAGVAHAIMVAGMANLNRMAEGYAAMKVSPRQIRMLLDIMFPVTEETSEIVMRRVEEKKQIFINAYNTEDNHAFRGTAWGLINAYTDCLTRKPLANGVTEETRFSNVTYGNAEVFGVKTNKFLNYVKDISVA